MFLDFGHEQNMKDLDRVFKNVSSVNNAHRQIPIKSFLEAIKQLIPINDDIISIFHLNDKEKVYKTLRGWRAPFGNRIFGSKDEKVLNTTKQLLPLQSSTTTLNTHKILSTVEMSPRQKEALRLHLQIFKYQRDLKGC